MKIILWLIMLLTIPSVMAITEVQYSHNNVSFSNATYTDKNNVTLEILDDGIHTCTGYYFRARHIYTTGASNWSYIYAKTTCSWSDEKVEIAAIIGIIGIIGFFMYLFHSLEDDHYVLKYLLLFLSVSMILLIPKTILESSQLPQTAKAFYFAVIWAIRLFWIYISIYFIYKILEKMGIMVSGN